MAAFVFTDPRTGKKYYGADGSARWAAYLAGKPAAPDKGLPATSAPLPPPPVGTYDPSIDYNAGASQRGYDQTAGDAQTTAEQGQQDYGLGLGDLTTGRDRKLADLLTSRTRLGEDFTRQSGDITRNYGILSSQQAEGAAQRGVTSQGLIGKSNQIRGANESRDQSLLKTNADRQTADIDLATGRTGEDFTRGKLGLDLGNARQFGGFNGQTLLNPLTGQPEFGSLLTGLTRAGGENNAFQIASAGLRTQGAAANGYTAPTGLLSTPAERAKAAREFKRRQGLL